MAVGTAADGRSLALEVERYIASGNTDPARLTAFRAQLEEYADTYPNLRTQFNGFIARIDTAITDGDNRSRASAGEVQTNAQAARDDQATSQNPPAAPESANASGNVSPTPPNTVPSNAEPSQQNQPATATEAPDKLPPGAANSDSTGGGTAQPTSVLPSTPQNVGLIQPALQSTATQSYIYRATIVDSVFEKGRFTQELTGALIIWPYDVQKAQSQSPQANPQRTSTDTASSTPLTGAQLLAQRENEQLPSVVRTNSTPTPVAVNGNKLLQDYTASQGFTFQSRPLSSSSTAANSGTNMLTPLTATPPTSSGQTVAPTFSDDVAQRKKQLTINPQQGNREP